MKRKESGRENEKRKERGRENEKRKERGKVNEKRKTSGRENENEKRKERGKEKYKKERREGERMRKRGRQENILHQELPRNRFSLALSSADLLLPFLLSFYHFHFLIYPSLSPSPASLFSLYTPFLPFLLHINDFFLKDTCTTPYLFIYFFLSVASFFYLPFFFLPFLLLLLYLSSPVYQSFS